MQLQLQLLITEWPTGPGGGAAGGGGGPVPPGPTFYILQESGDHFLTEDGDLMRQE